ncbi:MAG: glycosyltransferase family A protein [Pseudomonadota bacterium]
MSQVDACLHPALEYPLVTAIIPAYNSELYIAEAINSVLQQDYPAIEIIVVDDGSADNTRNIVLGYGDKVRIFSQANKGQAAARNLGILQAHGKYVAFLDADDVWWSHKISYQVAELTKSGHKMAYSRYIRWNPELTGNYADPETVFSAGDNPELSAIALVTGWTYADLLLSCLVWTSSVIVEKSEVEKVGLFDEDLRKGQDYDLWLRLSRQIEMLGLEQPTALYRIHPANVTSSLKEVNYEYLILSKTIARWGQIGPDQRAPAGSISERLARSTFVHGYAHLKRGNPHIAASEFIQSMKHSGLRIKPLIFLAAALGKTLLQPFRKN